MKYEIKYDRIPEALSSDLLRCSFCGIMRAEFQKQGPSLQAVIDGTSNCCTLLTIALYGDYDLSLPDDAENAVAFHTWYHEHLKTTPCPSIPQGEYLLDVAERILERAKDCRLKTLSRR